jgi:hypothetical protein
MDEILSEREQRKREATPEQPAEVEELPIAQSH